jgi:uncharacterized protein
MPTTLANTHHAAGASSALTKTLMAVSIIGALNWGLVGFFRFNLVHAIFGGVAMEQPSVATRVIYMIVGLCGLVSAFMLPKLHIEPRQTTNYGDRAP